MILSDIRVVQKHSIIKTCKLKFCSVGTNVTSSKSSFMGWVCKEKSYLETGSCLPSQVLTSCESKFWGSCSRRISQGSKHLAGIWRLRVSPSISQSDIFPRDETFKSRKFLSPTRNLRTAWIKRNFNKCHRQSVLSFLQSSNLSNDNLLWERAREQYDNVSYNG